MLLPYFKNIFFHIICGLFEVSMSGITSDSYLLDTHIIRFFFVNAHQHKTYKRGNRLIIINWKKK